MLIKYKSLTDRSDKKSSIPKETYKKPEAKKQTGYSKPKEEYVEKPSYDVIDDDLEEGIGFMVFYMFF